MKKYHTHKILISDFILLNHFKKKSVKFHCFQDMIVEEVDQSPNQILPKSSISMFKKDKFKQMININRFAIIKRITSTNIHRQNTILD